MNWIALLTVAAVSAIGLYLFMKTRRTSRLRHIQRYHFHKALKTKLSAKCPHLSEPQIELVFQALRQYFHMCNYAGRNMVAMPSQVVDDVWHEFILFTRAYTHFCYRAFGRYLHHTPAEAMQASTIAQEGIKRAWRLACYHENISPKNPERLPLIFAIDAQLGIPTDSITPSTVGINPTRATARAAPAETPIPRAVFSAPMGTVAQADVAVGAQEETSPSETTP